MVNLNGVLDAIIRITQPGLTPKPRLAYAPTISSVHIPTTSINLNSTRMGGGVICVFSLMLAQRNVICPRRHHQLIVFVVFIILHIRLGY